MADDPKKKKPAPKSSMGDRVIAGIEKPIDDQRAKDLARLGQTPGFVERERDAVGPSSAASEAMHHPVPPMAARDATRAVPGGQPQSLADDVMNVSAATDPFRKGSVAEFRQGMSEDPVRPASGAIPPKAVPVGDVSAAHDILSPAGGMASMRRFLVTRHPNGTETKVEVDEHNRPVAASGDGDDPDSEGEADRQAEAMHTEMEKRNADIRSRRPTPRY